MSVLLLKNSRANLSVRNSFAFRFLLYCLASELTLQIRYVNFRPRSELKPEIAYFELNFYRPQKGFEGYQVSVLT